MGAACLILRAISPSPCPVTLAEFISALSRVFGSTRVHHGGVNNIFGLAISGGVDSMALALLCSQLKLAKQHTRIGVAVNRHQEMQDVEKISFRAFIVDHGVRPGSKIEADLVAKVLEGQGIEAHILKLSWHGHNKPVELPNFESLARKYRFQALGRACKDFGINSLLLAHHQDDQAETVLMRLLAGHRGRGLMGIKDSAEIPECFGIHGVHESGGIDFQYSLDRDMRLNSSYSTRENIDTYYSHFDRTVQLAVETGGVKVFRPFLHINKARLIATCEFHNMKWFEDQTNNDPTLTPRNAVRHMYNSRVMPAALAKPALLAMSERIAFKTRLRETIINEYFSKVYITQFETRSGILRAQFPAQSLLQNHTKEDQRQIAASLLRRIINLVTPEDQVLLSSLYGSLKRIFPELFGESDLPIKSAVKFTVAGVQFEPHVPSKIRGRKTPSLDHEEYNSNSHEWLVSRQTYRALATSIKSTIVIPTSRNDATKPWSSWTLWDGRFWLRIWNFCGKDILIRPFRKEDLKPFRNALSKEDKRGLEQLLREIAPGDVRWTLPAIIMKDNGEERVLALPTIKFEVPDASNVVKWEVRYKKVDGLGLAKANSVDPVLR